jgi:hypothetical protein
LAKAGHMTRCSLKKSQSDLPARDTARFYSAFFGAALALCLGCSDTVPNGPDNNASAAGSDAGPLAEETADGGFYTDAGSQSTLSDGGLSEKIYEVDIRIHILSSNVEALNAEPVTSETDIGDYFDFINNIFGDFGIKWRFESFVYEDALNEDAYFDAMDGGTPGGRALGQNIDLQGMLAPNGFDAYIVRQTADLGFGGVYICATQGEQGQGAVFVPVQNANGNPQAKRKWAHEMGHAMGLPHTPCEEAFSNNLMMSGSCSFSEPGRVHLEQNQIDRIYAQLPVGGPAECGTLSTDGF